MPNRILRDGILTSPRVKKLNELVPGWGGEVFYRRLHSAVDDFGRYFADPDMLIGICYPRDLRKVTTEEVATWLDACERVGLVRTYSGPDGERYLEVLDFKQQQRAKRSKYPDPPADAKQVRSTCAADATQVKSNAHLDVDVDVGVGGVDTPSLRSGVSEEPQPPAPPTPTPTVVTSKATRVRARDSQSVSGECWEAYTAAFQGRYKATPPRNATVNGQLANLVARLGAADAPQVAGWYVSLNDPQLVRDRHPIGLLLNRCESYHTRWQTAGRETPTERLSAAGQQTAHNLRNFVERGNGTEG